MGQQSNDSSIHYNSAVLNLTGRLQIEIVSFGLLIEQVNNIHEVLEDRMNGLFLQWRDRGSILVLMLRARGSSRCTSNASICGLSAVKGSA
jgi:hypothetical protein